MNFLNMKKIIVCTLSVVVIAALSSCGGGTNNQGTTFTAFGFFQIDPTDGTISEDVGVAAVRVPLSVATGESLGVTGRSQTFVAMGLQNNLSGQFIRTNQVTYSFEVAGGGPAIPDTTGSLGAVAGPAVAAVAGTETFESSLPEGFANGTIGNIVYAGVSVLPGAVRSFISLNRGSFPEAPFDIIVTMSAKGVTSAGDRIETNDITMLVIITPETVVGPSAASTTADELAEEGTTTEAATGEDDGGAVPTEEFLENEG